jgi:hypothetical protein
MKWKTDTSSTSSVCAPEALTAKLSYVWLEPGKPVQPQVAPPFWTQPEEDELTEFIEGLAEEQWRVDFIRQQIARLKLKSKARSRIDLLRQLLEGFLDPDRFARQFATLNEEEQRYYFYLLLHTNLSSLRTEPVPLDRLLSFSKPSAVLTRRILDAGLGLVDEGGEFFVPCEMFKLLPVIYLPFDTGPPPATYVPAADPRLLLTKIHQLLGLVQSRTYRTRPRPRWRMPRMGYYGTEYQVWPPVPADAQRLLSNPNQQGAITLCPPEPYLDEATIAAWSADLELMPGNVEFLYHTLIDAQLLLPGSPVTLNTALVQPWMMQTPGDQLMTLFRIYRSLADWTDWWPDWRAGSVKVQWNYQNYWMLSGVDNMVRTMHYMLRWVILDILAYLPHDVWLSVDKVVQFLEKLYPEPKSHYYQQGLLCKDAQDHWKGFLDQVLRAMLCGPLYILGFVEAAPDLDALEVFRLRHFQSLHWNRPETVLVEDATLFGRDDVVFRSREQALSVTPPAKADFLIAVQQWSEPRGLVDNKLRYQLDVSRLHGAFEQGETPETLAETWEQHAGFPPLPDIQQWWQAWWARYGHIRLYTGQTTLVTRDEFTMQELQVALPSMRQAIMGLVTPRVALLQAERVNRIVSDLARQGYMPKEEA